MADDTHSTADPAEREALAQQLFDPQALLCKEGDGPTCLTGPQVAAARQYYAAGRNPRTGEELFPALARGSELGWGVMGSGPDPYGNPDPEWPTVDWRAHLHWIEVPMQGEPAPDGRPGLAGEQPTSVNYVELSPEKPESRLTILFVHGLSGSWQNWLENIPHFARTHRVIALDLPGFGHSPLPAWQVSIESYGRLVHRFCEALGVGDCAIVGNSMGGFISAEAAADRPDRFEPRRIKRRPKSHKLLLKPRQEYKRQVA